MSINIPVTLIVNGSFRSVMLPEELAQKLLVELRNEEKTLVHLMEEIIEVEGVVVTARGAKYSLMVLPEVDKEEEQW